MGARLNPAVEPVIDVPEQYVTFLLGGECFAIGILHVKEIIEYGELTEVPTMPEAIRGVINLRGSVVPVVDLSARFGRRRTEISRRTCIVIVEVQADERKHDLGVVVDAVSGCSRWRRATSSPRRASAPACVRTSSPASARSMDASRSS